MTTTQRRIALLTGASLATLGTASPALAAPHTGAAAGRHAGISSTADTIVICDIATATPAPVATTPCFFGDIETGTASAHAFVSTAVNGQIFQHDTGPLVDLLLTNNGNAEIGAIATAANPTGAAVANATVLTA